MAGSLTRERLEELEEVRLSAWALRSAGATRRHTVDAEGRAFDFRTEFQRDRDRIVHSRAFRRLRQKTQVYLPDRSDHFRNRMIHTLEVTGIARTLARALSLNEDLAEAIALGHDVGHCPFGRSGEAVLHGILSGAIAISGLNPEIASVAGGFRHNHQSLRVVDLLEKRYRHDGLNLTDAVREGILKHTGVGPGILTPDVVVAGLALDLPPFFEAQVVALADEIAQQVHDLDDGLADGAVDLPEVERLGIVRALAARMGEAWAERGRHMRISRINRGVVHLLVVSAAAHSAAALAQWAEREEVVTHDDFLARRERVPANVIGLPPAVRPLYAELTRFVRRRVVNSFVVNRSDARARRFLTGLFEACYRNPLLLEDHVLLRFKEREGGTYLRDCSPAQVPREVAARYHDNPAFLRLLADHIAAMTDTFALAEYERLCG